MTRAARNILLLILIAAIFGASYYLYAKGKAWLAAEGGEYTLSSPATTTTNGGHSYIASTTQETTSVLLYYYDPVLDQDGSGNVLCSEKGLVAVPRTIPRTTTPITDTLKLLLSGQVTPEEKASGIQTEFPLPGVSLDAASLQGAELALTFSDPNARTSGGSCRVSVLWAQIRETALQFPEVQQVRFLPEDLFQP